MTRATAKDFTLDQTVVLKSGTREHQVALARLDGLNAEQTAKRLGCTFTAVKVALRRARRMMGLGDGRAANRFAPPPRSSVSRAGEIAAEFTPERLEMLSGRTLDTIKRLISGETEEQVAVATGVLARSVATKIQHARSVVVRSKPMIGSAAYVARTYARDVEVARGPRCRCGLLLPCHSCVGEAADYLRIGAEGGVGFAPMAGRSR